MLRRIIAAAATSGSSRTQPKVRTLTAFCLWFSQWCVSQILKAFQKNSPAAGQLLSKKLEAFPCCRRALCSLCQKMSHGNKWEHTCSALQAVNGRLLVVCGLFKAFSGICVVANSFCWSHDFVLGMLISIFILAHWNSALLLWSYIQWCLGML